MKFQNFILLLASTLIALAGAEVAVRMFAPQPLSGSWFIVGPLGSYINEASGSATHVLPDRTVTYELNSRHQRGRVEPDPRARKVLVLGDSFTFGIGLKFEDTYVQKLQRDLDANLGDGKIQLLNAGVGGGGTADQLAYLEAFGDGLDLSAVIVFVSFADFERAVQRGIYVISPDTQELLVLDRSSERSRLKKALQGNRLYEFLLEHSHLVQLMRNAVVLGGGVINEPLATKPDTQKDLERRLARLLFRRLAAWCQARHVQLTVLTTGWPLVDYPWLDSVLREETIYFVDLGQKVASIVAQNPSRYTIASDAHPNEAGAAIISAAAWPILEKRLKGLAGK